MRRLSRILALALAGLVAGPAAAAGGAVTLELDHSTALVGSTVTFTGSVTPVGVTRVEIFRRTGSGLSLLVGGDSHADGSYRLRATVRSPGQIVARAAGDESAPVDLRIRPVLSAEIDGAAILGGSLTLRGRVRPAGAGTLTLTVRGNRRVVALGDDGRFRALLPTRQPGRLRVSLELDPAAGYAAARRGLVKRIRAPLLSSGSRGRAVRFLEQRLEELRYVVRGVDRHFGSDTRDAVYAFQKIKGLPRNGVVGPRVWRRLLSAHVPKAAVPRGTHIEVDKSKQALFEVRRGKVVRVVHVSTGATGNTPLGRWRVYRKTAGFNVLHMYYSLYFHRGFAIHGYASVPPFPASHGCVRVPLWYARGLYSRWDLGTPVYVFS